MENLKEMQFAFPESIWAGNQASLDIAYLAYQRSMVDRAKGNELLAGYSSDVPAQDRVPFNVQISGSIGILNVRGALSNTDDPWARYFGMTQYVDLRASMVWMLGRQGIEAILLDIDSGGGAVSGVADTANFITKVDKVKPVFSFTGGDMGSAAYWLGSSARKVYNSPTAAVGSVGVIATHKEFSKALEKEGVTVTQVRSGKFKALASPYEPLSDAARQQIQDRVDATSRVFIEHVAKRRGMTVEAADKRIGQGREFVGQQAVDSGASDGVFDFEKVVSIVNAVIDKNGKTENNPHIHRTASK